MVYLKKKDRIKTGLLKSGEIATLAGVLPSTIRYYSRLGLLEVSEYTQGEYKLFKKTKTLAKLAKIKKLKSKRLTLDEINKKELA